MKMLDFISIVAAAALLASCGGKQDAAREASDAPAQAVVNFNADSAYAHVKAQCDFGPRVPSTPAHEQCGAYLEVQLARYCDTVYTQHADLTTHDGKVLHATNYIGVINPDAEKRILLMAHWDCRPWADNDPDPAKRHMPVMGANDAASGVAVLLELARIMKQKRPGVGVDILLDDAEDWGTDSIDESWALGTQYWVHHTHVPYYAPMYGILLDMVGAKGATFYQEGFSVDAAPDTLCRHRRHASIAIGLLQWLAHHPRHARQHRQGHAQGCGPDGGQLHLQHSAIGLQRGGRATPASRPQEKT